MSANKLDLPINIKDILKQIPHRYPMLLVDRILDVEMGKKIICKKNVTINEHFFIGHFEEYPVMPGVLIIEALAQAAGILSVLSHGPRQANELYLFAAINKVKFKRQVIPGDTLILDVELKKSMRGITKFIAKALVEGLIVAEAELMIAKKGV